MAVKSDNGEGSGEHAALPEWNVGETEMLRSLFLEEAEKHLGRIVEAKYVFTRKTIWVTPNPKARGAIRRRVSLTAGS